MFTTARVTYECQPYTIAPLGYLFCGTCHPPKEGERVYEVPSPRSIHVPAVESGWRRQTAAEYRSSLSLYLGPCDGCKRHPADFQVFTNTGTADVEHTPARNF